MLCCLEVADRVAVAAEEEVADAEVLDAYWQFAVRRTSNVVVAADGALADGAVDVVPAYDDPYDDCSYFAKYQEVDYRWGLTPRSASPLPLAIYN